MSTNTILASAPLTSTGYHLKANGTTLGNSLIWDNGTNVGIGNTNTSFTFDVTGNSRFTTGSKIATASGQLLVGSNTSTIGTALEVVGDIYASNKIYGVNGTAANPSIRFFNGASGLYSTTGDDLGISTNGASRLYITSTGAATFSSIITASGAFGTSYGIYVNGSTYGLLGANRGASTASAGMNYYSVGSQKWFTGIYENSDNFGFYNVANANFSMVITSGGNVNINGSGFSDVKFYVKGSDATSSNFAALFVNGSASNLFNIRNDGAVQVFGSLSKGSGSFRIDHPLESMTETHQLVHSFIEGPRVDLIYRGKLTLVNGKAEANIDEMATMTKGTFEALCREVQCFTTNESGWDLVKGKVIGNIIYIESQNVNSTDEISWMVIGERKDKHILDTDWTDDNGKVIVEPLKRIEPSKPTEPITN